MTQHSDTYWDELGVAWCAIDPDVKVVTSRLEVRLRGQARFIMAGRAIGLPLGLAGLVLGCLTIWSGWHSGAWNFVTRGVAIIAISMLISLALLFARSAAASFDTLPLSAMVDLAAERTSRLRGLLIAGLWSCAVAAIFGIAGTVIRTHLSSAPRMSPVLDLALIALVAISLALKSRQMKVQLDRFRALRNALSRI